MHADEYARMFELEDRYWWFVARRRLALALLRDALGAERPRVLDLGCGTGVVLGELEGWAEPVGLDFSPLALGFCRRRGLRRLVAARGESLPLRTSSFDAVLALDILEHIPDDEAAFREAYRVLRPGGALVLSVPAFRVLWGPHDVALMHQRRYRLPEIAQRLEQAGFRVRRISYSIFLLFPIVLLIRLAEKLKRGEAKASLPRVPGWLNRLLVGLQAVETGWIRRRRLPWGISVVAVAVKPLQEP
ncbi:MAG: class I SAM-dependent methyltransferase [Fimbriimonadaceae bacterium]